MSAIFTLSDDLIQAAKTKIYELVKNDGEPIVLDKPFSSFSIVSAKEEPKNSFFKFSPEELPDGADLNGNFVYIVSDKIN